MRGTQSSSSLDLCQSLVINIAQKYLLILLVTNISSQSLALILVTSRGINLTGSFQIKAFFRRQFFSSVFCCSHLFRENLSRQFNMNYMQLNDLYIIIHYPREHIHCYSDFTFSPIFTQTFFQGYHQSVCIISENLLNYTYV